MTKIADNQTAVSKVTNTQTFDAMNYEPKPLTPEQQRRIISYFEEMRANPDHLAKNLVTLSLLINQVHVSKDNGIPSEDVEQAMSMVLIPWHEMHYKGLPF